MTTLRTHTVVIGAGPGGYVAAIRLGQLGIPTILIDKGALGGTCLNIGCIPSKALISASHAYAGLGEMARMGINGGEATVDLAKMIAWKDGVVRQLTRGVASLVRAQKVEVVQGVARFIAPYAVEVKGESGTQTIAFDHAIIATGSVPSRLPGFEVDQAQILDSTGALALQELPGSMAVIGGGYIGMELGGVYQRLGVEVTVLEYQDRILPGFAKDLVRPVEKRFKAAGGEVKTSVKALGWTALGDGKIQVEVEDRAKGGVTLLEVDKVLVTTGRRPLTEAIHLEAVGLAADDRGFIAVDGQQRTAVPHIFAIGDVTGEPMLAHKASKEAEVAAEVIAGLPAAYDIRSMPAVAFTDPEIATVGLDVEAAKAAGHEVSVGTFPFAANGRALSLNDTDGFVRIISDAETEIVLGMEAVGPEASNLIAEGALAIEMGAQVRDIADTIHAHPTLAEATMEAAKGALGQAIHVI